MNSSGGIRLSDIVFIIPVVFLWLGVLYIYHEASSHHREDQIVRLWEPEFDKFMSKRGFSIEEVYDQAGDTSYYEVRKNGMTLWRIHERTDGSQPNIDYLGPKRHELAYVHNYKAAIQESLAEHEKEYSKRAAPAGITGD